MGLLSAYRTSAQSEVKTKSQKIERYVLSALIILVIILAILDIFEDSQQGHALLDLLGDSMFMALIVLVLFYLWKITPLSLIKQNKQLVKEISTRNQQAAQWQQRASRLMAGLSEMVNDQFSQWSLSEAEKEVALLLLKGLSHTQIAQARNTKSRTVRQQAASIYQKANLSGRAELSAFFLEDLWLNDSQSG